MATNYSLGDDKTSWETEANLIKPHKVVAAIAKVKPNRNASDSRDIFGDSVIPPKQHYTSVSAGQFAEHTSAKSSKFERAKPLPGFDRMTANRTNYELGGANVRTEYKTHNMEATMHPRDMRMRGVNPTYKARVDGGVPYDIVTGKARDLSSTYVPTGPRRSQDKDLARTGGRGAYNILSGRVEPKPARPPPQAVDKVKAPLGSLLSLRPPTGLEIL